MVVISEMGLGFVMNAPLRGQMDHECGWHFSTFGKLMKKLFLEATVLKTGFPCEVKRGCFTRLPPHLAVDAPIRKKTTKMCFL